MGFCAWAASATRSSPTLLRALWALCWLPVGSQDGPKSLQDDPKMAPRHTKTPPSRPLEPSRTPATTPRSSPELLRGVQEPPGTLQGSILTTPGAVWGRFGPPRGPRSRVLLAGSAGLANADTIYLPLTSGSPPIDRCRASKRPPGPPGRSLENPKSFPRTLSRRVE